MRQNNQDLFDKFKALQESGLKISIIAQQLGFNRRRFDKWAKQSKLPERNKMQPAPGSAETFRQYLRQRWDAGYRNGRMLLDELRVLGYVGTYKPIGKVLAPWRFGNVAFERSANEGESDLAILPPPPPNLTDPTQPDLAPNRGDLTDEAEARTHGQPSGDRRCFESGLSRLCRHAKVHDELPGASETIPT
jgi:hypothetical protein